MHLPEKPTPLGNKFLTPGVFVLLLLAANGLVFLCMRFFWGLGAVTNLNNQYPWGLWIAIDVAGGVALAAGGFTSAALGHIMHRHNYHSLIRPALLTALLGYTFVAFGVFTDIGRWYFIWHPLVMWNGNSPLFEVGICVMAYVTVLYIEFLPVVCERFIGKMHLPGFLSRFNQPIETILEFLDKQLNKTMFIFIILGVVLSCLHQSSLGTLMVMAGQKLHPLWQTPILPLLFLLSAISLGFPMVIMESLISARSFKLEPEIPVLSRLGRFIGPLLAVYLAFKLGDMAIRKSYMTLGLNIESLMFVVELIVGIIIPLRLFLSEKVLQSPKWLLSASFFVIIGVVINRINVFLVAYTPLYAEKTYFPSFGEISVTLGLIAIEILLYRFLVIHLPVISKKDKSQLPLTKYAIGGTAS